MTPPDTLRHSPAAERNREPLLAQLRRLLPPQGRALEIASGTGQHVAHFAAGLPGWQWQPTDADDASLASIAAWCAASPNVSPPIRLDILVDRPAPGASVDLVFCANMIHIAPWASCAALMRYAAAGLARHGLLVLYGPFLVDGEDTAPGNLAFDADLRSRDPAWGLRRLSAVCEQATAVRLALRETIPMPANNLMAVFGQHAQLTSSTSS